MILIGFVPLLVAPLLITLLVGILIGLVGSLIGLVGILVGFAGILGV